ncbi:DNA polymerase epsilon subunit C [Prunus yedoensis var. nudiflora]|uniref:DNA polymerase epsilon subunit C n=1 Tax=Prunus yedoensis var. nudiflora TaxID=2094558 RepID=A0A314XTG7_PRUYE|nr:DNA polymerase epsilon subunit C [Prunus yedoensis var. nudiflora]
MPSLLANVQRELPNNGDAQKGHNTKEEQRNKEAEQQSHYTEENPRKKKPSIKKTPETKKPGTKKTISNKNQISNGNVSDSDVEEIPSSSSESLKDTKQNEGKITKTPTPKSKKSNKKRKQKQEEEEEEVEEKEEVKSYTFPMERVKRIIRSEDSEMRISHDAVFLVNKATEKFLQKFCEDAHACCVKDRKKSLAYKHLSSVVSKRKRYDFLSDFVPEKIKAEDALAKRTLAEAKAD